MATERSVLVRLKADPTAFIAGFRLAKGEVSDLRRELDGADRSIDKFSGRLGLLLDAASALGPALVPIGAVGVPAVTGLASALGFAAIGAGTAVLAFQGVGDALDKVNKARLQPTVENLAAARTAMQELGPDARQLVAHLANLRDEAKELRDAAAGGLLPGVGEALDDLLTRGPEVEKILHRIGNATGELLADGAESVSSERWDDFFDFVKTEAPPAISALGRTVGALAHGFAELWMATQPLNDDALVWLETAADRFDQWATELDQTEGFQEFVDYIRANGPQVGDTLAAIAMALLDIVEAAAPVGAETLPILEAIAKVLSAVADSDLGTPLIAILAISRAVSLLNRGLTGLNGSWAGNVRGVNAFTSGIEKAGTAFVGLSAAGLILDEIRAKAVGAAPEVEKLTAALIAANDEQFANEFGGGVKTALGDLDPSGIDGVADSLNNLADKGGSAGRALQTGLAFFATPGLSGNLEDVRTETDQASQAFDSLDAALAGLVSSGGPERAQRAFDALASSQHLTADEQKALLALLPTYTGALQGAANDAALAAEKEKDRAGGVDQVRGALEGLNPVQDTNKDGIIDINDAIADNIALMEDRTEAINAAFDAETNYQRSLQIGSDREKAAAELREQIADSEKQGAEDRAELRQRLADAQHDLGAAKTPEQRQSARESIGSIQGQIQDSFERQADSVKDLREQLAEYAPTLDKTTKAGQANRDVLSQMAGAWNNLSTEQQNAKGKYESARDALIDQAKKFGASDKAAKRYADRLLEIPERIQTKLLLEKKAAQDALDAYSKAFNGLDGKTVKNFIDLRIKTNEGKLDRTGGSFDQGGYTGNAPVDQPVGVVHGREFVHDAGVTSKYRGLFEALHRGAELPGYRGGGFVDAGRMVPLQVSGPGIDYDRLGDVLSRAAGSGAPFIGQATFNARGDLERAERKHRRMRGAGGRS